MRKAKYCPGCGTIILPNEKMCAQCAESEARGDEKKQSRPEVCQYPSRTPCPASGAIQVGRKWYCRWHWRAKNLRHGEEISQDLRQNGVPGKVRRETDLLIAERISMLGLKRKEGEDRDAWIARMRAAVPAIGALGAKDD